MADEKLSPDSRLSLSEVLKQEYEALHKPVADALDEGADERERLAKMYRLIHDLQDKRSALCISGGGIRSATFALGVLQGLARHDLLGRFHYLSTVSGGGYIGSWLSAWIARHEKGVEGVVSELANQHTTAEERARCAQEPEPAPIRHLRNYSNYLSPELGLLSADTWTLVATYLRNLALNWLVLLPMLGAIMMPPRICVSVIRVRPGDYRLLCGLIGSVLGAAGIAYVVWKIRSAWAAKSRPWLWCLLVSALSVALICGWIWLPDDSRPVLLWVSLATGTASGVYGLAYVGLNRPSSTASRKGQIDFLKGCLLPLVISAILLTTYWAWLRQPDSAAINKIRYAAVRMLAQEREGSASGQSGSGGAEAAAAARAGQESAQSQDRDSGRVEPDLNAPRPTDIEHQVGTVFGVNVGSSAWVFIIYGALLHFAGWLVFGLRKPKPDGRNTLIHIRFAELLLILMTGAIGGWLAWLAATKLFPNPTLTSELYVCFAAPLYLVLFLVALTVFAGLSSLWTEDQDREWWARMGGWVLVSCVAWMALSVIVIFGPALLSKLPEYLAPLGGLSGLITLGMGGASSTASTEHKKQASSRGGAGIVKELAPKVAAPFFAVFFAVFISALTSLLLLWLSNRLGLDIDRHFGSAAQFSRLPDGLFHHLKVVIHSPAWLVAAVTATLVVFAFVMAALINSNKFSLHAMYRNRLIRAYLGASRAQSERTPNLFTGFDPDDNPPMKYLWPNKANTETASAARRCLLHVVNMALNLVGGEDLAWQERKAESFTTTALHSGSRKLGYRRSELYGGREGISLGTAVTISGAAANPNMGYHSSPVVAFLLTLFNARLGVWLGNPGGAGDKTFKAPYPRWPMRTMLEEAFGLTDDNGRYVNLSDGGHFDNLGLYEMVLRRCNFIVVSDAGCDGNFAFEDLGGAIRKIRIDMGVPIEFEKPPRLYSRAQSKGKTGKKGRYCALARIRYSEADGSDVRDDGWLLYIKPAVYGNEPRDVLQYAKSSSEFPHETTADQFFSESQFESYRELGLHEIEQILNYWAGGSLSHLAHHVDTVYLA